MYKNRIMELSRLSGKVGSKLQDPLMAEEETEQTQQEFTASVNKMEKLLGGIESSTEKIGGLKDAFKKAKSQNQSNEIASEMQATISSNNKLISQLKEELDKMKNIVEGIKKNSQNSASYRQIALKQANLKIRVKQSLGDSKVAQDSFKALANQTIKRHINVIQKDLTEQQIEEITQNPEKFEQLLAQKLNNEASVNLKNSVADIQSKYKDILRLEKTINECFQMMQDLGILVEYQGEQLTRIEIELDGASDFVNNGNSKLVDAKKHHKSANKKICWIIMLVVVLLAVVLIPVLVTQLK